MSITLLPTASLVAEELAIAGRISKHFGFTVCVTVRNEKEITLSSDTHSQAKQAAGWLASQGEYITDEIVYDDQSEDATGFCFVYMHRAPFFDSRVQADSLDDFINRYYKPSRMYDTVYDYHRRCLARDGFDIISRHESVTGYAVAYYPGYQG